MKKEIDIREGALSGWSLGNKKGDLSKSCSTCSYFANPKCASCENKNKYKSKDNL